MKKKEFPAALELSPGRGAEPNPASGLSDRSWTDSQGPMGYGTSRLLERVLAACGGLTRADLKFEPVDEVSQGGVLCALPALLTEGLLQHTRRFYELPAGYYPIESIFLYLGLLALVRCPSLEQTRYQAPGEWGKLLGLDRLPEVKTLRSKIKLLCAQKGRAARWQSQLAEQWMEGMQSEDPKNVGVFYVDGHVRVYHGDQGPLPRHYVAREKLLLRGTVDYWVNGMGGEPFFVVTQPIHEKLIGALNKVVPRLLKQAPQPEPARLETDPWAVRFTVVFDREGYSADLFGRLFDQRIAILTYNKSVKALWPIEEFGSQHVRLHTGQVVERKLAERATRLSNGLWVREVRLLSSEGSQGSILTTHRGLDLTQIAAWMKARWCQENFLKYMREHFSLDRLIEYGTEPLPDSTRVVNPAHRRLNQQIRQQRAKLNRLQAQFGAHTLPAQPSPRQIQQFQEQGGRLRQSIQEQTAAVEQLKKQRKEIPAKIQLKDLPQRQRIRQLKPESKHFIDTVKIIAYRAESALAGELGEHLHRRDDARALIRRVFRTPADLRPDYQKGTLTVRLHRLGSRLQDAAVAKLCQHLNQTQTVFPTTELRLIFQQIGSD